MALTKLLESYPDVISVLEHKLIVYAGPHTQALWASQQDTLPRGFKGVPQGVATSGIDHDISGGVRSNTHSAAEAAPNANSAATPVHNGQRGSGGSGGSRGTVAESHGLDQAHEAASSGDDTNILLEPVRPHKTLPSVEDRVPMRQKCTYCQRRGLSCFRQRGSRFRSCWHCYNRQKQCSEGSEHDGRKNRVIGAKHQATREAAVYQALRQQAASEDMYELNVSLFAQTADLNRFRRVRPRNPKCLAACQHNFAILKRTLDDNPTMSPTYTEEYDAVLGPIVLPGDLGITLTTKTAAMFSDMPYVGGTRPGGSGGSGGRGGSGAGPGAVLPQLHEYRYYRYYRQYRQYRRYEPAPLYIIGNWVLAGYLHEYFSGIEVLGWGGWLDIQWISNEYPFR
ncbi:hypothetical protein CALVIDRAFT_530767 [Calocera viscosa TUFC12733]|uniref:Zn(2)-C6 fungal-type domain-containing protein n=1 Tax=Calocera viscosa (strain TUFC12733) TaxID=1330018 RepID=A0A167HGP0_CALVF|nr:hypothetical protein CALVIDRAFT_530767 [Calocera viscosa TUFC12733]